VSVSVHGLFDDVLNDALAKGLAVRFRAHGDSMHPTIRDGETITAAPVARSDIVCGDVLLFRCSGRVLAHRVVALSGSGDACVVRVRGDAKMACDAPVPAHDVIGRVIAVVRGPHVIRVSGRFARLRFRLRTATSVVRRRVRFDAARLWPCGNMRASWAVRRPTQAPGG
jgi:hypothetical protein